MRWAHAWPVVLRQTGARRVHLVHAAGGPLGGDELGLDVDVGAGAAIAVHSAGATLVQPGAGAAAGVPARWTVTARVGAGGRLDWAPEPTVVADGAALESALRGRAGGRGRATLREIVVLGRHGQRGGRYTGGWRSPWTACRCSRTPRSSTAPTRRCAVRRVPPGPGRSGRSCAPVAGPAAAGARTADVRWAWTPLDGPGAVLLAVGTPAAVTARARRRGSTRRARREAGRPDAWPVAHGLTLRGVGRVSRLDAAVDVLEPSVSTTRRSATIAARYSAQSGCSPASVR